MFDDDASGVFRHIKTHPDIAGAHSFVIGDTLCVLIGSVFGSNVSTRNWEVVILSRTRFPEWLQTQPKIKEIEDNHKNILDLIKFPEDVFKPKEDFIQDAPDSINKGVIENGVRSPTQNAMFVDDSLMVDTWEHLRPSLASSAEALFVLLGHPEEYLRTTPLPMDKHYETLCSCYRKQLGCLMNPRILTVALLKKNEKRS